MKLVDKILLEFDMDILNNKIKNPETGRNIKVSSALSYDPNSAVYKKAHALVQNRGAVPPTPKENKPSSGKGEKSHKPKSKSYGISKECVELLSKKGFKGLNAYPQSFVKPEQLQFNPALNDKNKDSVWVVKFPVIIPKTGQQVYKTAYTAGFMKKSQVKKYKKISKIKEADITKLDENTTKLLGAKDKLVRDSACVLRIILKTGLRVGSNDTPDSGNLGVRTLLKDNVTIKGNKIRLDFIGKSYQENIAEFEDAPTAQYLQTVLEGKLGKERVFDCSYGEVSKVMDKINPKGINPKDLRTYKATQMAKNMLEDKKLGAPPPLPKNPKDIKKLVKEKLKQVFISVSNLLNNSPSMARNSYVHPVVITNYLDKLGLKPKEVGYKHVTLESVQKVLTERSHINPKELEILKHFLDGGSNNMISQGSHIYRAGLGKQSIEKYNEYGNLVDFIKITPSKIIVNKGMCSPEELNLLSQYKRVSFGPSLVHEAVEKDTDKVSGMDEMFEKYASYGEGVDTSDISDEDSDECEEYPMPEWIWNDAWDLVPINDVPSMTESVLKETFNPYKKLIGKKINPFGKGLVTILDCGDKYAMYNKYQLQVPHNPMGYAEEKGNYWVVKNERGEINILSPSFAQTAMKALEGEVSMTDLKPVPNVKSLQVDMKIYYKTPNGGFIEGMVVDDFGDGVFVIFNKAVSLPDGHSTKDFEIYDGEDSALIKNIYYNNYKN